MKINARTGLSAALGLILCLAAIDALAAGDREVFIYKMKSRVAEELLPSVTAALSPEGRASVDSRTNSIVIIDNAEGISQAKSVLASQDVRQSNIEVTVESMTDRDLRAIHARVDWAYRDSGWQIGTIPAPVPGSGLTALATAGATDRREQGTTRQTVLVMNDGTAEISTGQEIPFTNAFHHYAAGHGHTIVSTEWVSVDTGLAVHPRTIGEDRILLEITPWMRNLGEHGASIRFTEATTQIEVRDGESVILGSTSESKNTALREILRGGARARKAESTYLVVTARKR
ncbi:MAG: hypothetical protein Q8R92_14030 [Deltaproteobacteria bacterium]|nr:hypothetical protein [Deltaproteobacteria bacterium]